MELLIVVVVIAILAAITIVAYNGVTQQAKNASRATELAQWKKKAELHKVSNNIECPDGYVFVYGNGALGTSDFCVMKYEAKNDGNGNAVSTASGAPWASITQTAAIAAATASGGHLITEAEWMTIAADVLSVKYNWSGGEVGSGYIYQGHVNNNPASALAASVDDSDVLNGITGGTGTAVGTNSARVLYLTSGDAIWDFPGNVYEWTQQAVGAPTLTTSQIGVSGDSAFTWREYTNPSLSLGNLPVGSRPSTLAALPGLTQVAPWNSPKGVGQIYTHYAGGSARVFYRGGTWYSTTTAGVLAVALDGTTGAFTGNIGFRVAR
ncbi:MAG: hypothetical protein IV096_04095 [Microbacterium sp.]|nr:hypothetical protein [Microbacterium sp.]MBT9605753.1 hypothetical protein [Microbacterium sp.]